MGIFELLIIEDEIRQLITQLTDSQEIKNLATSKGMKILQTDGFEKAALGETTVEEVLRVTQKDAIEV
jgi:type II secretory ATPase GspE/PulE/Tfp pilus assembly ATPase PilB-like protein